MNHHDIKRRQTLAAFSASLLAENEKMRKWGQTR